MSKEYDVTIEKGFWKKTTIRIKAQSVKQACDIASTRAAEVNWDRVKDMEEDKHAAIHVQQCEEVAR